MRKHLAILGICFCFTLNFLYAQSTIQFDHSNYEVFMTKAKKEKKPVMIYFTGTGCFLCVKMEKRVFNQPEVYQSYNENFINVESFDDSNKPDSATKQLRRRFGVISNPTFIFIDSTGEIIHKSGYKEKDGFILTAKQALSDDNYRNWLKQLNQGKMTSELVWKFLTAEQKPSLFSENYYQCTAQSILDKYFSSIPEKEYSLAKNWKIIEQYVANPFSDIFNYLIRHQEEFNAKNGEEKVNLTIYNIFRDGLMINTDEQHRKRAETLVKNSNHPMANLVQQIRVLNNTSSESVIKDQTGWNNIIRQYDSLMNRYAYILPPGQVSRFVEDLTKLTPTKKDDIIKAKKWMNLIVNKKENEDYDYYALYALTCFLTNDITEAIKAQEKAIQLAIQDKLDKEDIDKFEESLKKYRSSVISN